jgi:hypothetical protein
LVLDPYLVSLYLTQVTWLTYEMVVNAFTVCRCTFLPIANGSLIDAESRHNGLNWAAIGD